MASSQGDELTLEQTQSLEDLINEEIAMMDLPTERN
jgi:hypothetical protein